jgi:16S rRNA (guanine527-N7)-methyltransferase
MEKLLRGARELGITLKETHLALFQTYYEELVEWNRRFNLTAITDYEGVQVRHFLDSLSCLLVLPRAELQAGARVIDVGTGAGFPGLPLRIVCPGMRLTLLEATRKKVDFLEHLLRRLGFPDVEVIHARAEDLAHRPGYREGYDWAIARALAEMPTLVEYLLPWCASGGPFWPRRGKTPPPRSTPPRRPSASWAVGCANWSRWTSTAWRRPATWSSWTKWPQRRRSTPDAPACPKSAR